MRKYFILFAFIVFLKLASSEQCDIVPPLTDISKDIRNNVLLPYLLGIKNNKNVETLKQFFTRMKSSSLQSYDINHQFNQLPEQYTKLRFSAKLVSIAPDKNFLAFVTEGKSQKYDELKIYRTYKKKNIETDQIYQAQLNLNSCENICLTSEGSCIACFNKDTEYEFFAYNAPDKKEPIPIKCNQMYRLIFSFANNNIQKEERINSIIKHNNPQLINQNKPFLFLNRQESLLGIVGYSAHDPVKLSSYIFYLKKNNDFITRLLGLPCIKNFHFQGNDSKKNEINPEQNPKIEPKTLDELFRRIGICKSIESANSG